MLLRRVSRTCCRLRVGAYGSAAKTADGTLEFQQRPSTMHQGYSFLIHKE